LSDKAADAAAEKTTKYTQPYTFVHIAVETLGPMNDELQILSDLTENASPECNVGNLVFT